MKMNSKNKIKVFNGSEKKGSKPKKNKRRKEILIEMESGNSFLVVYLFYVVYFG